MINSALIGFGKWGKVIYQSIQKNDLLELKYVCYNKTIDKGLIDNKIITTNNIQHMKFDQVDLIFISADPNLNFKLSKFFLIKRKNIFVEKPLAIELSKVNEILDLAMNLELILHVNYIHTYNKNFIKFCEYFRKIYNKNLNQQLILNFGSDGPVRKNLNALWDWGPHVFSCLFSLINSFNEFVIDDMMIIENDHKGKLNFLIHGNYKSKLKIKIIFGNKFQEKKTLIVFKDNHQTYSYEDKRIRIYDNKNSSNKNYLDITPLDFSINHLIDRINLKDYSTDNNSLEITRILKKIENKLLK